MFFPRPHCTVTHGTEMNSWVGGKVCFLKLQGLPSYIFLSCHKYIDTPDLPRACVSTGFGSQSTCKSVVGSRIAQRRWATVSHLNMAFQHYCDPQPLCPTVVFYHGCINPSIFISAPLRKFHIFVVNILKGTPASQRASKWRNWEADNSPKTRVRPIHVICEDWGLRCSPLQLACVADCSH